MPSLDFCRSSCSGVALLRCKYPGSLRQVFADSRKAYVLCRQRTGRQTECAKYIDHGLPPRRCRRLSCCRTCSSKTGCSFLGERHPRSSDQHVQSRGGAVFRSAAICCSNLGDEGSKWESRSSESAVDRITGVDNGRAGISVVSSHWKADLGHQSPNSGLAVVPVVVPCH